jgi:hypothetical protein
VVQVKTLKKLTPAAHSPATSAAAPGHAWAASPKSTFDRSRRYAVLSRRSPTVRTGVPWLCSTIVVTPDAAAADVPVGKSSRSGLPGSIRCTCVSTPPGSTNRPDASTVRPAAGVSGPT